MTADELFEAIAAHRSRLVDQLELLAPSEWDAPTLCDGWKVRHVVGHLVSVMDVPTWRFVVGAVGISGFNRKVDRFAHTFGERDPSALLERYRQLITFRRAPMRLGPTAPLMDVVVHSLDIERPLGLPAIYERAAAHAVLDAMGKGFPVMAPKARTKGLRLEASDLDWAYGSGPVVRGSAGDLMLAISGRPSAVNDLTGDGAPLLASRLR